MSRRLIRGRVARPLAGAGSRVACWAAVTVAVGFSAASAADPPSSSGGLETAARVAELLESAEAKRAAGDAAGGLDDLRTANVIVKETRGPNHPDLLPILEAAARIFVENGRLAEAEKPLLKALTIFNELATDGRQGQAADLAVCLLLLGRTHVALGRDEAAAAGTADFAAGLLLIRSGIQELGRAIEIFSGLLGVDSEVAVAARRELAAAEAAVGEVDASIAIQRQVLAALVRRQPGDPHVLAVAGELAGLLAESGRLAESITTELEALKAFEAAGGTPESRSVALRSLGELHLLAENFTPAEAAFREAAEFEASRGGPASAGAVLGRIDELRVRARRGDGDPAMLDGLLAGLEGRPENEASAIMAALRGGAQVALDLQDHARAADFARRACEFGTRVGADASSQVASQICLGQALLAARDEATARGVLERALRQSIQALGPGHPQTRRVVLWLAEAAAAAGDLDGARRLLEGVVGDQLPRLGERDEADMCRAVDATARLLDRGGNPAAGDALRTKLVDARRRQFGERHPHVASTLVHLATARQREKEHQAALPLFEAALEILEATNGPHHPDFAALLTLLAESQRAADDPAGAERSLARALDVWEANVGPSHPVTRETVRALALARLALGKPREALPLMERLLSAYEADPSSDPADVHRLLVKLAEVRHELGDVSQARDLRARARKLEIIAPEQSPATTPAPSAE